LPRVFTGIKETKDMKRKLVTAVAVLTLGAAVAIAAPHDGGKWSGKHGRGSEMSARLAEKLNLTDAQKEQIKAIRKESREQNAAFFQSMRETREQFRAAKEANDTAKLDALKATFQSQHAQMKQIRDAEKQRILTVLTPDQRTQFEQLKAERDARRGHRGGDHQ
jgi:periplasmic protein CpxP/Spy